MNSVTDSHEWRRVYGTLPLIVELLLPDSEKGVDITFSVYPSLTPVCYNAQSKSYGHSDGLGHKTKLKVMNLGKKPIERRKGWALLKEVEKSWQERVTGMTDLIHLWNCEIGNKQLKNVVWARCALYVKRQNLNTYLSDPSSLRSDIWIWYEVSLSHLS